MRIIIASPLAIAAILSLASPSLAQNATVARAPLLEQVARCRQIPADAERLSCFDRAAAPWTPPNVRATSSWSNAVKFEAWRPALRFRTPDAAAHVLARRRRRDHCRDHPGQRRPGTGRQVGVPTGRQFRMAADRLGPVRFQGNRPGTEIRVRRAALGSYQLTARRSRRARKEAVEMTDPVALDDRIWLSGQISPDDLAETTPAPGLPQGGEQPPDLLHEEPGQPTADEIRAAAEAAGLSAWMRRCAVCPTRTRSIASRSSSRTASRR